MTRAKVSVVIVNYNSGELLFRCIESIFKHEKNETFEVIVVDNASSDISVERARSTYPQCRFIENKVNKGFAAATNLGIRSAIAPYILLLNPDTVVMPQSLSRLSKRMENMPAAGIIGPRILNPDGSLQLSCRRFPSFNTALFNRYSLLTRLFPKNKYSRLYLMTDSMHDRLQAVDWLSGACMMIRAEVFKNTGLFDERFFMYCEDVDFCYQAKEHGWEVYYDPEAEIIHYIGRGKNGVSWNSVFWHHQSMYRFYKKHHGRGVFIIDVFVLLCIMVSTINAYLYGKIVKRG